MTPQKTLFKEFDKTLRGKIHPRDRMAPVSVRLYIENDTLFYSSLNTIARTKFVNDWVDFLKEETRYSPPFAPLTVEVENKSDHAEITDTLKQIVQENVIGAIQESHRELNRNLILAAFLSIAGLLCLGFIALFSLFVDQFIFREFFVVIAWVLIWRAVELFFFDASSLRLQKYKLMQLYFADYKAV